MLLAVVFAIIALFLFSYGLMILRNEWVESRVRPVDIKRLALVSVVIVLSATGFFRAFVETSVCTCGG
jgi:uncharacterized membrane protein